MTDVRDLVRRSREASTCEAFCQRVEAQAARLRADLDAGRLDSREFTLGLELEVYAVDSEGPLARVPDSVLDVCAKEIGVHNAELNTPPSRFDEGGIAAQARELTERFALAQDAARTEDRTLVLDALWTIPPIEGTDEYLGAVERDESEGDDGNGANNGVVIASNMRTDARYHALDNDVLDSVSAVSVTVPGATIRLNTVFLESLATSMQPHLLVPSVADFPTYFNAAIRTLGPILALGTNAPFLPADCYGETEGPDATTDALGPLDPLDVVDRAPHELRIPIFEDSMNVDSHGKVRVPRDIEDATDIVDRLLCDRVCAPFLREWVVGEMDIEADSGPDTEFESDDGDGSEGTTGEGDRDEGRSDEDGPGEGDYANGLWELDYKRSTYWRWVRPVFGGTPVEGACDERSLRIEYRSLPTQPSVEDVSDLSVLVAGLLRGLVATDHPLASLPWDAAENCFYDVVEGGFDADLAWVTREGERVSDLDTVYEDLFAVARQGLAEQGVSEAVADEHLEPLEARVEARMAPSDWKKQEVRKRVEAGEALETAIRGMQRAYIERAGTPFCEWL